MSVQYKGRRFRGSIHDFGEFRNESIRGRRFHGGSCRSRGHRGRKFETSVVTTTLEFSGDSQDFAELKAQLLTNGNLFEDPEFPVEESSIFYSGKSIGDVEWKRPSEIVDDPRFFVEGGSRFDVKQGQLGDCWLLAAIANLTLNERLFYTVVPEDNSFISDYCGIFHFRFWQYGDWVDVVVDDLLPTQDGRLCFMHSDTNNEFWSALLEKAYAKLHGTYEALEGGLVSEALVDLTGGITEMYELSEDSKEELLNIMRRASRRWSFMACSVNTDINHSVESETSEGLIRGHAYSITRLANVESASGIVTLVRLRNPWGNEKEWSGAWSDESSEWKSVSEEEKLRLGVKFEDDGEFWMSYDDFNEAFDSLEICNLSVKISGDSIRGRGWEVNSFEGSWIAGVTAGGCRNFWESFACNPQFIIEIHKGQDGSDDDEDEKCTVLISLMQKNRRRLRRNGKACLPIGFVVYGLHEDKADSTPLSVSFFQKNRDVGRSQFINLREVCHRMELNPGTYVIVPSTYYPNDEGDFLLRVFTGSKSKMKKNDDKLGFGEIDERITGSIDQMANLQDFFNEATEGEEMGWKQLQIVLHQASSHKFSSDVCKSLLALLDKSMTGKLSFEEFCELLKSVVIWEKVFDLYDKKGTGHLNSFELRQALGSAGYHLNHQVLGALVLRYGDDEGHIPFNDFIACAVKLKAMIDTFSSKKHQAEVSFTLEEWLTATIYS